MTPSSQGKEQSPIPGRFKEILAVARALEFIGNQVAGTEGRTPTADDLRGLPKSDRWLYEALRTTFRILEVENERRLQVDDAELIAAVESFLADEGA